MVFLDTNHQRAALLLLLLGVALFVALTPFATGLLGMLGTRRAEVARAYLVSQGVDPIRIEIATHGEGQLLVEGPGELADAGNRRGQFRLLIADPYLAAPKK